MQTLRKFSRSTILYSVLATAVLTTLVIYLTPLKHYNLISPVMHEAQPKDFYKDLQSHPNDYLFVDVRSPSIYQSAHAKGAVNIPIENLYDEHFALPRTGKKIVLICTTGRLAAIAYGYLQNWGFTNLVHIQGGLQNWTYEGLPLEGSNVQSFASTSVVEDGHQ